MTPTHADLDPAHVAEQATLTPTPVEWARVPRVNLLPLEIIEQRRLRRTQQILAVVAAVVVVAAGAGALLAARQVTVAQEKLDAEQARTTALQQRERVYAEVPRVLAAVDAARAGRERALGQDVAWYRFLNDLAVATPRNVNLATLTVTLAEAPPGAGGTDALAPSGIGEVSVTGTAGQFPDVATWLTQVAGVHGMDASRLQSASRGGAEAAAAASGPVEFATKVLVTQKALTHRYDRKAD